MKPSCRKHVRVIFVEPRGAQANVFDRFMTIPMLGPLYLATLAEKAGYDVSIINENISRKNISPSELAAADILCVSAMTATIERGKYIAAEYKRIRHETGKESWSIVGGIHASMIPEDVKGDFDQVFVGEAETKILDVLSGKIRDKIVYGDRLEDLDKVPVPDFKLLKDWEKMKSWPIMTSRGCPYDCTFCSVTKMFGRDYRVKSVDKVIEEIKSYDHHWLFFVDDHFVMKRKRTQQILDGMEKENLKLRWSCQVRTELSKDELLVDNMRKAGCNTVYIGFESINPESLKEMNKHQSVADIERAVRVFRKADINVHGMFMFGSDSDTAEIFNATSAFCKKSKLASVQYMIMTPLPGTVLFHQLEKENRLLHRKWEYYDAMHVVFQPKKLSPAELQQGMIDCYTDFYSYTHAFNDALNIMAGTIYSVGKGFFNAISRRSLIHALIKVGGRSVVRDWISHNRSYLRYLNSLSEKRI